MENHALTSIKIQTFGGIEQKKSPLKIAENRSFDASNVVLNNPYGALNNEIGMTKWATAGVGNPILALWQMRNRSICYLCGDLNNSNGGLYFDKPVWEPPLDIFTAQDSSDLDWIGFSQSPAKNIYCCDEYGGLHKQTSGSGTFSLVYSSDGLYDSCATPSGDIYISHSSGILKQTNETGNFVVQTVSPLASLTMGVFHCTESGDVYYGDRLGKGLYKQTSGSGAFVKQNLSSSSPDANPIITSIFSIFDDVYAITSPGFLFKQTGGVGDFVAYDSNFESDYQSWGRLGGYGLSLYCFITNEYSYQPSGIYTLGEAGLEILTSPSAMYSDICVNKYNDVYACVKGGDIYKCSNGSSVFVSQEVGDKDWNRIFPDSDGNIYACVTGGKIYKHIYGDHT